MKTWEEFVSTNEVKELLASFENDFKGNQDFLKFLYASYIPIAQLNKEGDLWERIWTEAHSLSGNLRICPRHKISRNVDYPPFKIFGALKCVMEASVVARKEGFPKGPPVKDSARYYWFLGVLPYLNGRSRTESLQYSWLLKWTAEFNGGAVEHGSENIRKWLDKVIFPKLKKEPAMYVVAKPPYWRLKNPMFRSFSAVIRWGKEALSKEEYKRAQKFVYERAPELKH